MARSRPIIEEHDRNDLKEQRARTLLVKALRDCGELADAVESFEGRDLFEVLAYLDSLRLLMTENQNILMGVVRADVGSPKLERSSAITEQE